MVQIYYILYIPETAFKDERTQELHQMKSCLTFLLILGANGAIEVEVFYAHTENSGLLLALVIK